jgi:hypothetical protein
MPAAFHWVIQSQEVIATPANKQPALYKAVLVQKNNGAKIEAGPFKAF